MNNLGNAGQTVQALRGNEFLETNEQEDLADALLNSDLPVKLAKLYEADYHSGSRTVLINTDWFVPRGIVDNPEVYTNLSLQSARKFNLALNSVLNGEFVKTEIYNALRPRLDDSVPGYIEIDTAKEIFRTKLQIDAQLHKEGIIHGSSPQTIGSVNEIQALYEVLEEFKDFKKFVIPSFKFVYDKASDGVLLPDKTDFLAVLAWVRKKGNINFGLNCFTTTAWKYLQKELEKEQFSGLKDWFYKNYVWHLPNVYDPDVEGHEAPCACTVDGQSGQIFQSGNFVPDLVATTQKLILPNQKLRIGGCCGSDSKIIGEFSQAVQAVTRRRGS